MKNTLFTVIAASLLLCHVPLAMAGIVYNESQSGDLSKINTTTAPTHEFTFGLGNNTISGSAALWSGDYDSFSFIVPVGLQLSFVSFDAWNAGSGVSSLSTTALYQGTPGSGPLLNVSSGGLILPSWSAKELYTQNSPFSAGSYYVGCCGGSGQSTSNGGYNYQWVFTLTVAPPTLPGTPPPPMPGVPAPAGVALFAMALLGLHFRRFRDHRAQSPLVTEMI